MLAINVEVRSTQGARLVIEKLQDWIAKQDGEVVVEKKKPFRIPPKKVIKGPVNPETHINEARSHAMNILDGLPDEPIVEPTPMVQGMPGMQSMQTPTLAPQPNLESVQGHASALL